MITFEFNLWSLHQRLTTLYFLFPSRWPCGDRHKPPDSWHRDRRRRDDQTHRKEQRRTHQEVTDLLHSRRQPANSYNPSFWRCVLCITMYSKLCLSRICWDCRSSFDSWGVKTIVEYNEKRTWIDLRLRQLFDLCEFELGRVDCNNVIHHGILYEALEGE